MPDAPAALPCPICGAARDEQGACPQCDAGLETQLCPHCGGRTRIEADARRLFRCGACGGPRIPTKTRSFTLSNATNKLLRAVRPIDMTARLWAFSAVAALIVGLGTGALALFIGLTASGSLGILFGAIATAFFVAWISMRLRGRSRKREANAKLNEAWQSATEDALNQAGQDQTAGQIASMFGTTFEHAEQLLSSLAAHSRARLDVSDEGALRFSVPDVTSELDDLDETERNNDAHKASPTSHERR